MEENTLENIVKVPFLPPLKHFYYNMHSEKIKSL